MSNFSIQFKDTATYQLYKLLSRDVVDFISTIGKISEKFLEVSKFILQGRFEWKELMYQCYRFGVTSLPITLSIVGMTSVIVAMQIAGEMVKQGGSGFVGMLMAMLLVREAAVIMSGFAIISMIGSSLASELATMRVTEQIDAISALKVNPVRYLFVPRVLSGTMMMVPVVIVATLVGVLMGGIASNLVAGLSLRAYFSSVWSGLAIKDIFVCLMKAVAFGYTIALISCTCGFYAKGGAKGVGIATTKAVVWSFVAIVIWDLLFAIAFFF